MRDKKGFNGLFRAGGALAWALLVLVVVTTLVSAAYFSSMQKLNYPEDHSIPVRVGSRADWQNEGGLPEFCKVLLKQPKALSTDCDQHWRTKKCKKDTTFQMFSQFHQDYFLYTRHFKHLNRTGVYLDIAAHHPVKISNSYFMDRCLGWTGICVEGNSNYFEMIYSERSCHLVPTCVGSRDGQVVEFAAIGGDGGILGDTYKNAHHLKEEGKVVPRIRLRCTVMEKVLKRTALTRVDYLSLDVEGHELEVLKGFNWDKVTINVMTIEVSTKTLAKIEEFLTKRGYVRYLPDYDEKSKSTGRLSGSDAIFLHKSVKFGDPR